MNFSLSKIFGKLVKDPSGNILIQIVRYFVSGGVAFAVDAGLLYLLTEWAGLHYLYSSTISFSVGLVITYLFSIFWVFDNRSLKSKWAEFLIFVLIGVVGLLLTNFFLWVFTDKLGLYYLVSKVITTVLVFIWNFIAKKTLLFRKKTKANE